MKTVRKNIVTQTTAVIMSGLLAVSPLALSESMRDSKNPEANRSVYESAVNLKAFSQVDKDTSGQVEFGELEQAYSKDLKQRDWGSDKVMDRFDDNGDNALNSEEYAVFARELLRSDRLSQNGEQAQRHGANAMADAEANSSLRPDMNREGQGLADYKGDQQSKRTDTQKTLAGIDVAEAERLEGRDVVNRNGDTLGEVEDVLIENSQIKDLVVSIGGIAGIGDKDVLVDAREFSVEGDKLVWNTPLTEDQLDNLPEYSDAEKYSVNYR